MSEFKRPENDELPPPEGWQVQVKANSTEEVVVSPAKKLLDFLVSYCVVPVLLLGLVGGCWWVGDSAKKKRDLKEAAEKGNRERHEALFQKFALEHGAFPFDPFESIPGLSGPTTADIQAKLASQPVALVILFPDLRLSNGQLRLSTDALEVSNWLFDLEIGEAQAAVVRQSKSDGLELWVIADVKNSNAKEEPRTSDGRTRMELVVRATGRVVHCQAAPR